MVVLSGSVICSSVVMFDSSNMFRYLWLISIGNPLVGIFLYDSLIEMV
jgi:hypothetical protein